MTILPASPPPSVILLGGASGSGKSYLARQHGRPHLSLDAFYRPQSDDGAAGGPGPVFPRTPYGEIDWDHPGTWDEQAAVDAVVELLEEGATRVPDYDISTSSVRGHSTVALEPGGVIVAEGIFAERMPAALDRAGVELDPRGFLVGLPETDPTLPVLVEPPRASFAVEDLGDLLGDDYQAAVRRGRLYVRKLK